MPDGQQLPASFGPNAWLVDEMYDQYVQDPNSVSESWREFFEDYRKGGDRTPQGNGSSAPARQPEAPAVEAAKPPPPDGAAEAKVQPTNGQQSAQSAPAVASSPKAAPPAAQPPTAPPSAKPLRGAAARTAQNMEASLGVPTATSFRVVPARLLEANRKLINNHLSHTRGGKISFTHLIGYAVVKALQAMLVMNRTFVPGADGQPAA